MQIEEIPQRFKSVEERLEQIEYEQQLFRYMFRAFPLLSRTQTMQVMKISAGTLKTLTNKGKLEYKKGARKIEYHAESVFDYLVKVKGLRPEAVERRTKEARGLT